MCFTFVIQKMSFLIIVKFFLSEIKFYLLTQGSFSGSLTRSLVSETDTTYWLYTDFYQKHFPEVFQTKFVERKFKNINEKLPILKTNYLKFKDFYV